MISEDAIQKLAVKYQTSELNLRREYFQHVFLSYFYRHEGSESIYFKGGTSLRLVYKSPRFSEDLDFDAAPSMNIGIIEHLVISAMADIEQEGVRVNLHDTEKTTGGYLTTAEFVYENLTTPIKIEISLREGKKDGVPTTISSDFFPNYPIVQLLKEQIVKGKLNALLTRKKPRDFYDFYFLLRADMLTEKKREVFEAVLHNLKTKELHFEQELKEYLPKSHWLIIRNFPKTLEQEIRRYL